MARSVKPSKPPAKPERAYRSTLRADQARETRRRIRDAADALFLERGYASTSMDDVAAAAGVSRQTVFTAFGSKANLLKEAFEVRLAGDDEPVAIADRPESARLAALTDPAELLRAHAAAFVERTARVLPLWPAMLAGAATDTTCAEVVAEAERIRLEGPGAIVDLLAERGQLRAGLDARKGKEAMFLSTNPSSFLTALHLGWSLEELQHWLGDCLVAVLLQPG